MEAELGRERQSSRRGSRDARGWGGRGRSRVYVLLGKIRFGLSNPEEGRRKRTRLS